MSSLYLLYKEKMKQGAAKHQKVSFAWRMTPKASASLAEAEIFNDCRISVLDVRRNGLQAFSSNKVVGT